MARIDPQINVRVAAEFKKKLEHAAIENGRSLNAEVVHRLEQSFDQGQSSEETSLLYQKIDKLTERVLELSAESREMRMLYIEAIQKKHG